MVFRIVQLGVTQAVIHRKPIGVPWPEGGVFVPKELMTVPKNAHAVTMEEPLPRDRYNPTREGKKILMDVQRTNPQQPKSLLKFVNNWGHLGIGIPDGEEFLYDGVFATGMYLKKNNRMAPSA